MDPVFQDSLGESVPSVAGVVADTNLELGAAALACDEQEQTVAGVDVGALVGGELAVAWNRMFIPPAWRPKRSVMSL